jgi:signal transduction histidine kinase
MLSENKRQIQLVKELKQLNATKDKFFSIISHDLRNPFQAILGFSDMLINNFDKYPKEQMLEFIGLINQSSKKAFELLENLLEWSNLQTKKMKPVFQSVSSYEIINEVTQLLSGMAEQKHISLIFDSTIDEKILTDRNMINTILRNLISNAIKFTGINGKIEIKTQSNSHTVAISIADNGMGMDKDDIEKLFKIETKISTTGTQGEKGTGLGLLLCKDLVELNHGSIEAVSEIGSGSTFTIRIPKYVEIE